MRGWLIGSIAATCVIGLGPGAMAQGSADRFEKKIRPLLAAKCWQCHAAEKQKGGLRLDSAEALALGGDSGPGVVAGKPEESRIIEAVLYAEDLKMPPKGKLSDAEIGELKAWVREGAVWPGSEGVKPVPAGAKPATGEITEEDRAFWAFQAVADPALPLVKSTDWPKSPIDRFILAGLERAGLEHAPAADRRDLIRRATFDLTGLPPSPADVDAFVADTSPDAFARVVDRLLASPQYGERWGRHWLDLARYADSNGMDENVAYANAYRYRDYVVKSFNADKPYDRFIKEQVAGDLLPKPEGDPLGYDQITATGFLVLGPKMLAEDDPMKMEMDIIDEQVDTVGRVFLGLTVGCARCHDHKFDPIPTADYYALAGIFKSTKSMENHKVVAMWNERTLASEPERKKLDAHRKEVAALQSKVKSRIDKARSELRKEVRSRPADYILAAWLSNAAQKRTSLLAGKPGEQPPQGTLIREAEAFDRGNVLVDTAGYGKGIGVILNKGELPNYTEYGIDVPKPGTYQIELRYAAAEARPVRLMVNGETKSSKAADDATGSWEADSQRWHAEGVVSLPQGRVTIRLESAGPFPHFDKLALVPTALPAGFDPASLKSPDELAREAKLLPRLVERWAGVLERASKQPDSVFRAFADRESVAARIKPALFREPVPKTPQDLAKRYGELFAEAQKADKAKLEKDPALAAFRAVLDNRDGPLSIPRGEDAEPLFADEVMKEVKALRADVARLEKQAPAVTQVMGVEDQKATDLRVHIRGSHLTLGDPAPRRFLKVVAEGDRASIAPARSGRLELAEWIARPDHPLTARVMVNRIWQGHFGDALVRSPDNFGRLGERPTHPELLDWLARRFVESGWSIKAMHRLMMLSSTYTQGTRHDAKAAQADPENRLYWRVNRRRLEAEAVRDAILAVSGELDFTPGGTLLRTANHAYVNNTGGPSGVRYDVNRRSVYLPVIRSGLYDVFQAFDFADPSASNGQRIPTTVAPQALFMLNDALILKCSEAMAGRLLARPGLDDAARLALAYRLAYGRVPTESETARALGYLSRFDATLAKLKVDPAARPVRSWAGLCQAILASSEFLYLD